MTAIKQKPEVAVEMEATFFARLKNGSQPHVDPAQYETFDARYQEGIADGDMVYVFRADGETRSVIKSWRTGDWEVVKGNARESS